jgi:hypothetical protein
MHTRVRLGAIVALASTPLVADAGTFSDALGDTFGVLTPQLDLIGGSVFFDANTLDITLRFAGPIAPGDSGLPNAAVGVIELDTDQSDETGESPFQNGFAPPAPFISGFGTDVLLQISGTGDTGALVLDAFTLAQIGFASVAFTDTTLTVSADLATIGDTGLLDLIAIFGTVPEPTDALDRAFTSSPVPGPGTAAAGRRRRSA